MCILFIKKYKGGKMGKKKYKIIGFIAIIMILLWILFLLINTINKEEKLEEESLILGKTKTENEFEQIQVEGYHLVTYAQSANTNSFIKTITVTAFQEAQINFVIGSIDEQGVIQERNSFAIECTKGKNALDLQKQRYFLKKGEYLFMDMDGQNILYSSKEGNTESLVQTQSNQSSGKMLVTKSNFALPFAYTLEEVKTYQILTLGNEITFLKNENEKTNPEMNYYTITKTRLEAIFDTVNSNRISAIDWEKPKENTTKKQWISETMKQVSLTDLDLVIFQLGDYLTQEGNLENDVIELVEHIRKYSPNAEMIWIGAWNNTENFLVDLPGICERLRIHFIPIHDLNVPEFRTSLIRDSENPENEMLETTQEIYYPNLEAMQMISNRIIEKLHFDF